MFELYKLSVASDENIIAAYNEHCEYDPYYYSMSEFDELMSGRTPTEIAEDIHGTDFSPFDKYFWFDDLSNLNSGDAADAVANIDLYDLADKLDYHDEQAGWVVYDGEAFEGICDDYGIREVFPYEGDDDEDKQGIVRLYMSDEVATKLKAREGTKSDLDKLPWLHDEHGTYKEFEYDDDAMTWLNDNYDGLEE